MKRLLALCCFLASALSLSWAQTPAPAAHKIRVLVLTGSADWSHPWQGTAPFLQGMLTNTGRFDVKLEEEVMGITAATLANYDVLVDLYYGPRWGPVTEQAVQEFVSSGKGMVGVHGITYGPFFGQAGGSATEPRRLEAG
jgi:type 1 glutamine amidotransferase